MLCIALDRLHEIGDQITTALELNLYLGIGLINTDIQTNQTVVLGDKEHNNECNDTKYDEYLHG